MAYARLAARNNQGEEGLKRLSSVKTEITQAQPMFPAQVLECCGDVYGAMGRKAEACYRKVLDAEFAPEDIKKSVKTKLAKLGQQG
jgi:predicted negative regulator of RcsB-dependent stress response